MDLGNCGITANLLRHHRVTAGVFDSNPIPIQPQLGQHGTSDMKTEKLITEILSSLEA